MIKTYTTNTEIATLITDNEKTTVNQSVKKIHNTIFLIRRYDYQAVILHHQILEYGNNKQNTDFSRCHK